MSFSGLASPQGRRNTILASVAVAALGVAGVLGESAINPTHPAYAAAVSTADLPQNAPSFAPLIDRVKASVVSVKVKIAAEDAEAEAALLPARARWTTSPRRSRSSSSSSVVCPTEAVCLRARHPMMMGEGSGFFVSADGYIVTNNHVVQTTPRPSPSPRRTARRSTPRLSAPTRRPTSRSSRSTRPAIIPSSRSRRSSPASATGSWRSAILMASAAR